ncbi:DUF2953 domain-containing protein [Methanobacterium petrolearium]|uniref:DUF2953 domain-containing protein n=1 Tax=Methanobacterium petrolearium TaxID=710190 RepID=UPI001FD85FDD|nr:DUF2953 domain-containing protein [Methanobacterium petrolearium]MBP1945142.1 hypothetical protein [Methanobacterium petrolearium]BDZ71070.1 hypothetical protein GCM10025861_15870 [Methanobacterium petrolearium]
MSFLLIPLKLSLNLKKHGSQIKGKFSLIWLGIRVFSREIPEEKDEDEKKKKEKEEKDKKEKFDVDGILKILNLFLDAWPHIHRLLVTIYHSFSLEKFSLDLVMGLESPADTALFTGYIWAFTNPLTALTPIHVLVTPEFNRRVLDGNLQIDVKLKLFRIVVGAIRAYTKKPVRELIKEIRS